MFFINKPLTKQDLFCLTESVLSSLRIPWNNKGWPELTTVLLRSSRETTVGNMLAKFQQSTEQECNKLNVYHSWFNSQISQILRQFWTDPWIWIPIKIDIFLRMPSPRSRWSHPSWAPQRSDRKIVAIDQTYRRFVGPTVAGRSDSRVGREATFFEETVNTSRHHEKDFL